MTAYELKKYLGRYSDESLLDIEVIAQTTLYEDDRTVRDPSHIDRAMWRDGRIILETRI